MTVDEIIGNRGIGELMHFTTNRGALGVLASGYLKSRARLNSDEQLKHIFQPNAISRDKDLAWLDFVNLSVSRINARFFEISGRWHRLEDIWWCVLSFSPEIMTHDGVHFATTNNAYSGVQRAKGAAGLNALFDSEIEPYRGYRLQRLSAEAPSLTTCPQAEVLYPSQVSTEFLKAIYVRSASEGDELAAQMQVTGHRTVDIIVNKVVFGGQ